MKKCYCCGARVPDEARFCPYCGKPMEITQELFDRACDAVYSDITYTVTSLTD